MNKEDYKWLEVGGVPLSLRHGVRVYARPSTYGCEGCSYDKKLGAGKCRLSPCCMGHLRPDRTSVIFVARQVPLPGEPEIKG